MGPFNNREIATALWLLAFAAWALREPSIQKSLAAVLRTFCDVKILVAVCLMVLYTAMAVASLAAYGLWKPALLKDTVVWFCLSAFAMIIRFGASDSTEKTFREILTDNIKIVIILEFLVNAYSFSLPAELIIVPVIAFIAMVGAVAELDKKYTAVARVTEGVQAIIGLVIIAVVVIRAISDVQALRSIDTVRSIALARIAHSVSRAGVFGTTDAWVGGVLVLSRGTEGDFSWWGQTAPLPP